MYNINKPNYKEIAEYMTIKRLIAEVYPTGIVSLVSDTYDFWAVLTEILPRLKDVIMSREGKVVIRPDSGDPVKIVTGYMHDEIHIDDFGNMFDANNRNIQLSEAEVKGAIQCLFDVFGGTETSAGYIQLCDKCGLIYGDSITILRATQICERLALKGFASTNLVYGIGSFTYQGEIMPGAIVTRDTYGFAVKSTYGEVEDRDGTIQGVEIFKDPQTDDGLKKSAKGLTAVFKVNGEYVLQDQVSWEQVKNCEFVKVFANGMMTKEYTLSEIRERVAKNL